ncbi:MAG TPA: DUF4870 domain-containing protein [Candidatus Binataceae bacterium]|nr:DUF4870 domain-containing protein [Candidatus Binataceae bacterium]
MNGETTAPENKPIAALTYVFGLITGLIFLNIEPYNHDEFVRFHARQSIVFSVACIVLGVVLSVFMAILPGVLGAFIGFISRIIAFLLAVYWIFLMYKALNGERYRIPRLADWADSVGL